MNFKFAAPVAASLSLLAVATGAYAQAPATFTTAPSSADLIASQVTNFDTGVVNGQFVSGSLSSAVYNNNGLRDFYYQLTINTASSPVTQIAISDFSNYTTAFFQSSTLDIDGSTSTFKTGTNASTNAFADSGTAYFFFNTATAINPGQTSATLLVRTNSTTYTTNNAAILGAAATNAQILAPSGVAVPEASSLALLAPLALGMIGVVRRKVAK